MKIALRTIALAALLAPTVTTQTDPLGNWIIRPFGFQPAAILLNTQVQMIGDTLQISVTGGQENGPVAIIFAAQQAQLALLPPLQGQLWVAPDGIVTQQLDGNGNAVIRYDLANTGLNRFYLQVAAAGPSSQLLLSRGYELDFFQTGNITYLGPQLTAQINVLETAPVQYELEVHVAVPTRGWSLTHDGTSHDDGVEKVRLTLRSPSEFPAGAATPPISVRVSLGSNPGYAAKVMVSEVQDGAHYFVRPAYNCAAMINITRSF